MSALDGGGTLGMEVITDTAKIARCREIGYQKYGIRIELQPAEAEAGLTEADIWRFLDDDSVPDS